jgi:hypothetical protein
MALLLGVAGCEDAMRPATPAGGGGGGDIGATAGNPFVVPSPTGPTRLEQNGGWVYREGKTVSLDEQKAAGWTIDVDAGLATYLSSQFGSQIIKWAVPPRKFARGAEPFEAWLSGQANSMTASSLNLTIGLKAVGTANDGSEDASADSKAGSPADTKELRRDFKPNWSASKNAEASLRIKLGWQAPGWEVVYSYRYL